MKNSSWQQLNSAWISLDSLGLSLDYSRIGIDQKYIDDNSAKTSNALHAMKELESGQIANPDENRMVGHYWLRTPELCPSQEIKDEVQTTQLRIAEFAEETLKSGNYRKAILIGIGGSALGPQLLNSAFEGFASNGLKFSFMDNTDPDGIDSIIAEHKEDLNGTLAIVISKSGSTVETANAMHELATAYEDAKINFPKHAIAITLADSKLESAALSDGWLRIFHLWDWVGGRTSITSPVGLLPAALMGLDINSFLAGASEMDRITRGSEVKQNPALILALSWQKNASKNMVVLPYKDRLLLFSRYLQQLIMESVGKALDLDANKIEAGLTVYGNKGSTDQHAFIQQLRDGRNDFFLNFLEVLADYPKGNHHVVELGEGVTSGDYLLGFAQGTRLAMSEKDRPSVSLIAEEFNERTFGAIVALYERAVGFYASLLNINAYHQPGVEAGKKAAGNVIDIQRKIQRAFGKFKSDFSAEEMSEEIGLPLEVESVFRVLEHLASNPGRGLKRIKSGLPKDRRYEVLS